MTKTQAALAGLLRGHTYKELAELARSMTEAQVEAGTVLTREGTPGAQVFLIVDGTATATVHDQVVGRVGPGEFVGEMAVLARTRRSATVTADTTMRLLVMAPDEFAAVFADRVVSMQVAQGLSRRLAAVEAG